MDTRAAVHVNTSLARWLAGRIVIGTAIVLVVSVAAFLLLAAAPGDIAVRLLGAMGDTQITQARADQLRLTLGLDAPLHERYLGWLGGVLSGDFGRSLVGAQPVAQLVGEAIGPTLLLTGIAMALIFVFAAACGTVLGLRPRTVTGRAIGLCANLALSVPTFVIALTFISVFAVALKWLPAGGMTDVGQPATIGQVARHLILPVLAIAFGPLWAGCTRVVAAAAAEALRSPHVEAARMRGIAPGGIVVRHILRLALVPLVAQFGASATMLIEGAYIAEIVFSWPGLGSTLIDAARAQDFPVLSTLVLLTGLIVVVAGLVADAVVVLLDPRLRRRLGRPAPAVTGAAS